MAKLLALVLVLGSASASVAEARSSNEKLRLASRSLLGIGGTLLAGSLVCLAVSAGVDQAASSLGNHVAGLSGHNTAMPAPTPTPKVSRVAEAMLIGGAASGLSGLVLHFVHLDRASSTVSLIGAPSRRGGVGNLTLRF